FSPRMLWRLLRLLRRQRIDLVHWNFSHPLNNSYLWWLTLLRPGLQHCYTDHNSRWLPLPRPRGGLRRAVKRLCLKRYRRVVCVSHFVEQCLRDQSCWSNLLPCLHFINTDRFRPDAAVRAAVRREQEAEGHFVLLTVAHLIKEKGIDVALKALRELPETVVLWVVGSGVEADSLRALAG